MALVFPFDHKNKKFDKGFYSSFLTDGRASSEQIESLLKEVEEAFKEKLKWLRRLKAYLVFAFVTGVFLMTFYSLAIFSDIDNDHSHDNNSYNRQKNSHGNNYNDRNKNFRHHDRRREYDAEEQLDLMFFGWFVLLFAALFWAIVYGCAKRASFRKARTGVQEVIDRHAPIFSQTGIRWNVPLAFPHYIELWKDYKGQNFQQQSPQQNNQMTFIQPNNQVPYHANPLSYQQIYTQLQNQNQNQNQNQKYPTFNQVVDQRANLDFQNHGVTSPLLHIQAQNREVNAYIPPYPVNYHSNA
jgi:hypothetical protein